MEYALFEEIILLCLAIHDCFSSYSLLSTSYSLLGSIAMDDYLENLVSLERLSNARRPKTQPLDQLLKDSLAKVQKYLAAPVEEDILVEDESKAHRQWLMRTWNE